MVIAGLTQKEAAKRTISNLAGVKGVTNNIVIKSESKDAVEKSAIDDAIERNWAVANGAIKVTVTNNNVKLTGTVHSLYQKEEAGRLAWNAPGVSSVDNDLAVDCCD